MTLCETPGALKRFRRTPWKFQQTFQIPLNNLELFIATIIAACEPLQSAAATIEQVVFEPQKLTVLLESNQIPSPQYHDDSTISAIGRDQAAALLHATLSSKIDFIFVPTPKPFVIYADHDDYITFFAHTRSNLNRATVPLARNLFKHVDYERRF